jgi:hypothetical protein
MIVERDGDEISQRSAEAMVITGDGLHETYRIKAIADKFDAQRKLFFPYGSAAKASGLDVIVGKTQTTDPDSRTGLNALRSIEDYHNRKAMRAKLRPDPSRRYIFVADKEDKNSGFEECIQRELQQIADSHSSIRQEELDDCAYKSQCDIGSLETTIYCAFVGGDTGCFEDGISNLLELRENKSINATNRDELKGKLSGILGNPSGEELLKDSEKWQIQSAFPNISACFREFES